MISNAAPATARPEDYRRRWNRENQDEMQKHFRRGQHGANREAAA